MILLHYVASEFVGLVALLGRYGGRREGECVRQKTLDLDLSAVVSSPGYTGQKT